MLASSTGNAAGAAGEAQISSAAATLPRRRRNVRTFGALCGAAALRAGRSVIEAVRLQRRCVLGQTYRVGRLLEVVAVAEQCAVAERRPQERDCDGQAR